MVGLPPRLKSNMGPASTLHLRYLPYSELDAHRANIARFGQGLKPIEAIARPLR